MIKFILILFLVIQSESSLAWGGKGHQVVCEASAFLVKNEELRKFLVPRTYILGHLCIMPDSYWRGLPKKQTQVGNTTHYINPGNAGFSASEVPLEFEKFLKGLKTKEKYPNNLRKLGSNWWRARQFYQLAIKAGEEKKLGQFINYLGIMGHFVGDNGSAFHVVADYDGFDAGHGGIHDFFETQVVGTMNADLLAKVVKEAEEEDRNQGYLASPDLLTSMRELAVLTEKDVPGLLKSDMMKTASKKDSKVPATREAPTKFSEWYPVIIKELARSAALQAKLMDEAYEKIGKPDLHSKPYHYPFKVPYVAPDYLQKSK